MIGIVMLHTLNYCGMLANEDSAGRFIATWIWEIAAYSSVNCFVLISGYCGYRGEKINPNLKNIINLMFNAIFYSVTIILFAKFFLQSEIGLKSAVKAFFPITTRMYWFFSSYFVMYIFSPLINTVVNKASKKTLVTATAAILIVSVMTLAGDAFALNDGNSAAWFSMLYLIGATIKKYDLTSIISSKKALMTALFGLCGTYATFFGCWALGGTIAGYRGLFIKYSSPTVLVAAVGIFMIFSKINIPNKFEKAIDFIVPSVFCVYLIHDNRNLRAFIFSNLLSFVGTLHPVLFFISVPLIAVAIFIICLLIDRIRLLLFKILKTDKLAARISETIKSAVRRIQD